MQLDYSIEYDAKKQDFKGTNALKIINGPLWISIHTIQCSNYIYEKFGLCIPINTPMRFSYTYGNIIRKTLNESNFSGIYGGFYK